MRTGTMTSPLHGGKAPYWLFNRMTALSREIISVIIIEFGTTDNILKTAVEKAKIGGDKDKLQSIKKLSLLYNQL